MRWLRWVVYSNVYVAGAAAAMTGATWGVLTGFEAGVCGVGWVMALVFFGTVAVYAADRLFGTPAGDAERGVWVAERRGVLWGLVVLGGLGAAVCGVMLPGVVWWVLGPAAVVCGAYCLPVLPGRWVGRQGGVRLAEVGGLRLPVVVLVWSGVTAGVPIVMVAAGEMVQVGGVPAWWWGVVLERVLFLVGITLPFEVRDLEVDRSAGLRTWAGRLGLAGSRWVSVGVLGGLAVGLMVLGLSGVGGAGWAERGAAAAMAGLVAIGVKGGRGPGFYAWGVDGTMWGWAGWVTLGGVILS